MDWGAFAEEHWEQRPAVLRGVFNPPIISEEDLFDGLLHATEDWCAGVPVGLSFHVDNGMLQAGVGRHLPTADDRTLPGYVDRIDRELARDFALFMAPIQRYQRGVWLRAIDFLAPLFSHVGLPGKHAELELFFGKYRFTPFGVHRDTASNFMTILSGTKRVALWPADYFEDVKQPGWIHRSTDIDDPTPYLEDALILEGSAGDVFYWPSSYWHIGVSDGTNYSAALVLGLMLHVPGEDRYGTVPFTQTMPSSDTASERDPELEWLRRYTAFGFETTPPLSEPLMGRVRRRGESRVTWIARDGGLVVGAHGHLFEARSSELASLERIVAGAAVDATTPLVRWLTRTGALDQA